MLISLKIHTKTLNTRDFCHKNSQFERFQAEYTKNLGHSMRFFRKIRKFALFSIELTPKFNNLGRKLRKIRFFSKTSTNFHTLFLQIITCGYILAQKLKQLFYHTQIEVVILHKLYLTKPSTIIVENTENSPYSSSYTIEYKIVRNSHLLSHKIGIFSSATAIVLQTSINCSHTKSSKQQLTAHMSIVKGDMDKVLQTHTFLFECTIVFTGVKKSTDITAQNAKQINLAYNTNSTKTYHNGSFFLYKNQRFY